MAVVMQGLSAEEYLALDDDRRTELIGGEVVVTGARLPHQRIVRQLLRLLERWIEEESGRGEVGLPVDVVIDGANVFAPDLWWVADARRPATGASSLDGLPDLAVEVRSPSTWRYDVGPKFAGYERTGLPELWLVDSASSTVLVYRRSTATEANFDVALELGGDVELGSPLLAGFSVPVSALFGS